MQSTWEQGLVLLVSRFFRSHTLTGTNALRIVSLPASRRQFLLGTTYFHIKGDVQGEKGKKKSELTVEQHVVMLPGWRRENDREQTSCAEEAEEDEERTVDLGGRHYG